MMASSVQDTVSEDQFLNDILNGLAKRQKQLPSKYFYDQRGSELFDEICELDEYYPTRTELEIMRDHAPEMARCVGTDTMLIEFGSGSSVKSQLLLDELRQLAAYVPVDVSREHLFSTARRLRKDYPSLLILPVCADFTMGFQLPGIACNRNVVYFPGSTIGNFTFDQARELMEQIADLVGENGGLLLGVDLLKETSVIEQAYNDKLGVTADFNLNLLNRINKELNADFQVEQFGHEAFFNECESRIEMHLRSLVPQTVEISDESFFLELNETICTEFSHKYDADQINQLIRNDFKLENAWFDQRRWFGVFYFSAI